MTYLHLSSQAQAIVDAYDSTPFVDYDIGDRVSIAAVLRATVEQLAYHDHDGEWRINPKYILDIAEELEQRW